MLHGVHPLLRGVLLAQLDALGHGDAFVIADANFPARRLGRRVVDLPGASAAEAASAIFSVAPPDPDEHVVLMRNPGGRSAVQRELLVATGLESGERVEEIERFAFYDLAAAAELVVATGETRAYGNLVVRKAGIQPAWPGPETTTARE